MNLSSFWIFLLCFALVNCSVFYKIDRDEWDKFKVQFSKIYDTPEEDVRRYDIFRENLKSINSHNKRCALGLETFSRGLNQFADMLENEVSNMLNGFNATLFEMSELFSARQTFVSRQNVVLPNYVNWAEQGAVTPVKDQKQCASCYAFAATAAMESHHYLATKKLIRLSEQNIIDCSVTYGNDGCKSGWAIKAYQYAMDHGIDTESSYPYENALKTCRFGVTNIGAKVKSFVQIKFGDELGIKQAVATIGPVAVSIDASHKAFHSYHDGVYSDVECNSSIPTDHVVLIVGYGTDDKTGQDYWIIKNSWGTNWGLKGYVKFIRNKNMCHIGEYANYPIFDKSL